MDCLDHHLPPNSLVRVGEAVAMLEGGATSCIACVIPAIEVGGNRDYIVEAGGRPKSNRNIGGKISVFMPCGE